MKILITTVMFFFTALACAGEPKSPPPSPWKSPMPSPRRITQAYGGKFSHTGLLEYSLDYQAKVGTAVLAARGGVVASVRMDSFVYGKSRKYGAFGNSVVIKHNDGLKSHYIHLGRYTSLVRVGERVIQGEQLAKTGLSGFMSGPHLHFDVRQRGKTVPVKFSDFHRHRGTPKLGDSHGGRNHPTVSQAIITMIRVDVRAATVAKDFGYMSAGKAITSKRLPVARYPKYHQVKKWAKLRKYFAGTKAQKSQLVIAQLEECYGRRQRAAQIYIALSRKGDISATKSLNRLCFKWIHDDSKKSIMLISQMRANNGAFRGVCKTEALRLLSVSQRVLNLYRSHAKTADKKIEEFSKLLAKRKKMILRAR